MVRISRREALDKAGCIAAELQDQGADLSTVLMRWPGHPHWFALERPLQGPELGPIGEFVWKAVDAERHPRATEAERARMEAQTSAGATS